MKTIILMTAMFLTMAFGRPASADVAFTLFSGFLSGVVTVQFVDDKQIVDGTGSGNSSLGTFTCTSHSEVNPSTGKGRGTYKITFANGDTWGTNGASVGDITGAGAINQIT